MLQKSLLLNNILLLFTCDHTITSRSLPLHNLYYLLDWALPLRQRTSIIYSWCFLGGSRQASTTGNEEKISPRWKWQKKGHHLHSFTIVKETQDYFLFTHPDICTLHPSLPSSLPTGWPSWITSNEPPGPLASCWVWPMGSPTGDRRFSSLPAQQWGSSGYVPLSQATTLIRWPSPTVRALVDFRQWFPPPRPLRTRSGSCSLGILLLGDSSPSLICFQ